MTSIFNVTIVLAVLMVCAMSFAAEAAITGTTEVMKWKDGKRAVFFLAFDDSCPSHLTNAIPELEKRNLVGTFYINAANGPYTGKRAEWLKAAKSPAVVIGNHTYAHKGVKSVEELEVEVDKANDVIREITTGEWPRIVSFARPGGVPWEVTAEQAEPVYVKRNLVQRPPFAGPPIAVKTNEEMMKYIATTVEKGQMGHFDFHGVGGDWLVVSMDWFVPMLDELVRRSDELWVTDHATYVRYTGARDAAKVDVQSANDSEIKLSVKWDVDAKLYDHPLTLRTQVPAEWGQCEIKQGGVVKQVPVKDSAVMYEAGQGDVVLRRI